MPTAPIAPRTPRHRAASRQRRPVLQAVIAATVVTAVAQWPGAVHAQGAAAVERSFDVDLPAQPLAQALAALSRQSGIQVFAGGELVSGRMAPAVRGRLGVQQALDRLLAGSGLVAASEGSSFTVKAAPPSAASAVPVLPAVTVTAKVGPSPGDSPAAYAGGQVARGSRLGLMGNTDVFDTPFSTKSYTNQYLQDQQALRVDEVFQNDASIRSSTSQGQPLDQSSIRGFLVYSGDYLFDGVAGLFDYGTVPVQNYERVEVIKGPNALLFGMSPGSTVGGTINIVPKRALDKPTRQVSGFVSDTGQYGTQFDIGQRFGRDNEWGARLNLYATNGDAYAGNTSERVIAPLLAVDYRGQRLRAVVDFGVTDGGYVGGTPNFVFNGTALPASPDPKSALRRNWDTTDRRSTFGLLSAQADVADNWTASVRVGQQRTTNRGVFSLGLIAFDDFGNFTADAFSNGFLSKTKTAEVGLNGRFTAAGVTHSLALSANRYSSERGGYFVPGTNFASNIYTPTDAPAQTFEPAAFVKESQSRLSSVGIADTIGMYGGALSVTLGARHQQVKYEDIYGSVPYNDSRVTPAVAVLWKPLGGLSVYANYIEALSQGETAPLGTVNQNTNLAPVQTKQAEVGAKWDFGSWGLTTALFDIRKPFGLVDADNRFVYGGEQRNRGFELESFGEPWRGVRVLGGVAFIDGKQTKTADGATDGKKAIGVPELQLNLGVEWDTASVPGLTLTGRFIHTDKAFYDATNTVTVPSWNRLDLGVRYRSRAGAYPLTLRANLGNATNDGHWEIAGRNLLTIAAPRTLRVSATVDF